MSLIDAARHFLRTLFARDRLAREMDDELRFHLELDAMQEDGAPYGRRFGHVESIREERRRAAGLALLDRLQQDATYTVRQLTRAPGFAAAVALTLALGVGANATMFAIVDRIMLRAPEGIADAEHVMQLRSWRETSGGARDTSFAFSYASFIELREMADVFESVSAVRGPIDVDVERGADAMSLRGTLVGGDYFRTLAVRPALGRFFAADEIREPAGVPVAVISHGLWRSRYGEDYGVLGRTVVVNSTTYTIVGVAPENFTGHTLSRVDIWLPIASSPGLRWGAEEWWTDRGTRWLMVYARLHPQLTRAQAAARIHAGWTAWNIRPGRAARAPTPDFASIVPGRNSQRPEYRVATMLSGVALLLLAVTSANVANLLLARALMRRREVAIRLALGVSRARLAALFLMDAIVLALLGGAAALALAWLGVPLVRSVLFEGTATGEWSVDLRVAAFSMIAALAAGLAAGIVPAIQATRPSLLGALRRSRDGLVHRSRTRRSLLIAQGALTVSLLAGTGLFVRSLQRIGERELGLDLHRVLVADFADRGTGYSPELLRELYDAMRRAARRLPGVESASLSVGVPFEGQYALPLAIPGHDSIPGMERGRAPFIYAVTPDFFQTMGTRIIAGRGLLDGDDVAGAPSVAVVSASMAKLIWPRGDALGQCFKIVLRSATPDCTRVVGVAEDAKRESLTGEGDGAQYYMPLTQAPRLLSELTLLVRAANPRAVAPSLAAAVQTLRADLPFVRIRTLADAVAPELRPWRTGASVFGLFGALALIVAAVGTYSVIQFGVSQRRHELGVRIVLGARRRELMSMVVADTLRLGTLASVLGVVIVAASGSFIREHLYQTSPRDPVVLAVVVVVLFATSVVATIAPAWSATRVDPLSALKSE